jgi:hypothetical protein
MGELGTKLIIVGLLIRAIMDRVRRKNPVVVQLEFSNGPKRKRIKVEIRTNTVPEAEKLFKYINKERQALLN